MSYSKNLALVLEVAGSPVRFVGGDGALETEAAPDTSLDISSTNPAAWVGWYADNEVPLVGDAEVSCRIVSVPGVATGLVIGFDAVNPDASLGSVDFAAYIYINTTGGTRLYVYESNTLVSNTWAGSNAEYTFGVRKTGTVIEYILDGVVLYTSAAAVAVAMVVDNAIRPGTDTMHDIVLTAGGVNQVIRVTGFSGTEVTHAPEGPIKTDVNCILSEYTNDFAETLPEFGGVANPSNMSLTLADPTDTVDALFSRTSEGSMRATLVTSIAAGADNVDLAVTEDLSAWAAADVVWVGQEAFRYAYIDQTTRTFKDCERGYYGSVISQHRVDSVAHRSFKPQVVSECTAWDRRACVLSVHEVLANGTIEAAGTEILRGFLAGHPLNDTDQWRIELTDDLARLARPIGAERLQTTLVNGYINFDGANRSNVEYHEVVPEGGILDGTVDHDAADTIGGVSSSLASFAQFNNFLTAGGGSLGDSPLTLKGIEGYIATAYSSLGLGSLTFPSGVGEPDVPGALNEEYIATSEYISDSVSVNIAEGVHRWPNIAVSSHLGLLGPDTGTSKWLYSVVPSGGTALTVQSRSDVWRMSSALRNGAPYLERRGDEPGVLHYGFLYSRDDSELDVARPQPVALRGTEGWVVQNAREANTAAPYEVPAPALAFWEEPMKYLLVADDILDPAPGQLRVSFSDGREAVILRYTDIQAASDPDTSAHIGYRVTIDNQAGLNRSEEGAIAFGNWPGEEPVTIGQDADFGETTDPLTALVRVLLSGSGTPSFPNAEYSTLPQAYGVRVNEAGVDIEGILATTIPSAVQRLYNFTLVKAEPANAVFGGILQAATLALVAKTVDGSRKLTLVPMFAMDKILAKTSLTSDDIVAGTPIRSGRRMNLNSQWTIKTNYNGTKFENSWELNDGDAIDLLDGDMGVSQTIEIRGMDVNDGITGGVAAQNARVALVDIYKKLRTLGRQLIEVTLSVLWSKAKMFSVGDVVLLSSEHIWGGSGVKGISEVAAQVTARRLNFVTNVCEVKLVFDGVLTSGYAPVMRVDEVDGAQGMYLTNHAFSGDEGLPDWCHFFNVDGVPTEDYVQVDDLGSVELVQVGEEENNTTATPLLLVRTVADGRAHLFFAAAHGLSVGDVVRPLSWDSAHVHHKEYVYFAQDGVLGVGDDEGFRYS